MTRNENGRDDGYVFVAGVPRSGNTLLRLMLSAHPLIVISPETHSLEAIFLHYPRSRPLTGEEIERLKRTIRGDTKLAGWKVDMAPYWESLEAYASVATRRVAEDMMRHYRDGTKPSARILGNKKGFFIEFGEVVFDLFPEAKLFFIVRDPRDSVLSMKEKLAGYDIWSASLTWRRRAVRAEDLSRTYSGRFHEVRYEDLVCEPEAECRRMCAFLGIDFAAEMLRFYEGNRRLEQVIDGQEGIHGNTSNPLTKKRIGAWRGGLTDEEVQIVESVTGQQMKRLQYALHTGGFSSAIWAKALSARMRDDRTWRRRRREMMGSSGRDARKR